MEANGGSIRDMAENERQREDEETPEELFPTGVLEGDELSFLDLFKKGGRNVQVTVSMRAAEFPSPANGLLDPEKEGLVLLTYRWTKPEPIPQWGDAKPGEPREIKGWKLRQVIEPIFVEKISGEAGVIEANFAALLHEDPVAAGALLDRLKERTSEAVAA